MLASTELPILAASANGSPQSCRSGIIFHPNPEDMADEKNIGKSPQPDWTFSAQSGIIVTA